MNTKSEWLGVTCAECKLGAYRPGSQAPEIPIENAGAKRLSKSVGYVFLLVALLVIVGGLVEQFSGDINGVSVLFYPGVMLGVLAQLMIQWGKPPEKKSTSGLLCDKCGAAVPAQVDAPEEVEPETAPVGSTEAAMTEPQEPDSAKAEPAEDSEIVQVKGACGVCSTRIDAMIMSNDEIMDHHYWGARTGGYVCPACGVLYCDSCKKKLGFSWFRGLWKNARCKSCGANMIPADGSEELEANQVKCFVLADNWVRTIQKKLADPDLDAQLAIRERRKAKRERQATN